MCTFSSEETEFPVRSGLPRVCTTAGTDLALVPLGCAVPLFRKSSGFTCVHVEHRVHVPGVALPLTTCVHDDSGRHKSGATRSSRFTIVRGCRENATVYVLFSLWKRELTLAPDGLAVGSTLVTDR